VLCLHLFIYFEFLVAIHSPWWLDLAICTLCSVVPDSIIFRTVWTMTMVNQQHSYLAMAKEVQTRDLLAAAFDASKLVHVPKIRTWVKWQLCVWCCDASYSQHQPAASELEGQSHFSLLSPKQQTNTG
jgi:hypothetical protein